jgi:hypothetical protein
MNPRFMVCGSFLLFAFAILMCSAPKKRSQTVYSSFGYGTLALLAQLLHIILIYASFSRTAFVPFRFTFVSFPYRRYVYAKKKPLADAFRQRHKRLWRRYLSTLVQPRLVIASLVATGSSSRFLAPPPLVLTSDSRNSTQSRVARSLARRAQFCRSDFSRGARVVGVRRRRMARMAPPVSRHARRTRVFLVTHVVCFLLGGG